MRSLLSGKRRAGWALHSRLLSVEKLQGPVLNLRNHDRIGEKARNLIVPYLELRRQSSTSSSHVFIVCVRPSPTGTDTTSSDESRSKTALTNSAEVISPASATAVVPE